MIARLLAFVLQAGPSATAAPPPPGTAVVEGGTLLLDGSREERDARLVHRAPGKRDGRVAVETGEAALRIPADPRPAPL